MPPPETFVEKVKALIATRTDASDGAKFKILLAGGKPKKAGAPLFTDKQLLENKNRSAFESEFANYLWKIKDTEKYHHSSEAKLLLGSTLATNFTSLANKMLFFIKDDPEFKVESRKDEKDRDVYMFTWSGSESAPAVKEAAPRKTGFDAIMELLDKIEIDFELMDLATSRFDPARGNVHDGFSLLRGLLYFNARIAARKVTDLYMEDKVQIEPFDFVESALDKWLFDLVRHFGDCCELRMHTMTFEELGTLTDQQLLDKKFMLDVPLLTFEQAEQIVQVEHDTIVDTLEQYPCNRQQLRVFRLYEVLLGNAKRTAERVRKYYKGVTPKVKIPAIDFVRMATKIKAAEFSDGFNFLKPLICWLFDFVGHVCMQLGIYEYLPPRVGKGYGYVNNVTRRQSTYDARINYGLSGRVALNHSAVEAAPDKFPELPLKHSGESWYNLANAQTNYVYALHLSFDAPRFKLTFDEIITSLDKLKIKCTLMDLMLVANPAQPYLLTQLLYSNARTAARMVTNLYMENEVEFEPFDFQTFNYYTDINRWLFNLVQHLGDCCKLFECTVFDSPRTKLAKIRSKYDYGLADAGSTLHAMHALDSYLSENDKQYAKTLIGGGGKQKMTIEILSTLEDKEPEALVNRNFLLAVPFITFKEAEKMLSKYDEESYEPMTTGIYPIRLALLHPNLKKMFRSDVCNLLWVLLGNAKRVARMVRDKYSVEYPEVSIPALDFTEIADRITKHSDDWGKVCAYLKPLICWLFDFVKYVYVKYPCDLSPDSVINYGMSNDKPDKHSAVVVAPDKFPELPLKHSGESWFNLAVRGTNYVDTLHLSLVRDYTEALRLSKKKHSVFGGGKKGTLLVVLRDLIAEKGGLNKYITHSDEKTDIQMELLLDFNAKMGQSKDYKWLQEQLQTISREQNTRGLERVFEKRKAADGQGGQAKKIKKKPPLDKLRDRTDASFFDRGIINCC